MLGKMYVWGSASKESEKARENQELDLAWYGIYIVYLFIYLSF